MAAAPACSLPRADWIGHSVFARADGNAEMN